MNIETPEEFLEKYRYATEKTRKQRLAFRDAAIRADELQKAAERADKWLCEGFAEEWLSSDAHETLRAAIMADPQTVDDDWTEMAEPEEPHA